MLGGPIRTMKITLKEAEQIIGDPLFMLQLTGDFKSAYVAKYLYSSNLCKNSRCQQFDQRLNPRYAPADWIPIATKYLDLFSKIIIAVTFCYLLSASESPVKIVEGKKNLTFFLK